MSASGLKSARQCGQMEWGAADNLEFREHDIRGASSSDAESDVRAKELLDHESVSTTRISRHRETEKKSMTPEVNRAPARSPKMLTIDRNVHTLRIFLRMDNYLIEWGG